MATSPRAPHADHDHSRTTDLDTDYADNSNSNANGNAETSSSSLRAPSRHEHEHELEDEEEDLSRLPASSTAAEDDAPMPWRQLIVLILMRFAEPICFTQIFPYVNRMMLDIGAAKSPAEVGFYGGLIESLFALTQLSTVLAWGAASDKYGRKPIMLIGLAGTTLSQIAFGFSRTFWQAVAARCLAGALNGNVAIIKSIVGELVPAKRQARAFSFLPLCWAVGCTIGPLLGGYLSHPEEQYPDTFDVGGALYLGGLWLRFPYLLPCLISASSTAFSILMGLFFLEETLPSKVRQRARAQAKRRREAAMDDDASTRPLLGSPRSGAPSSHYGATERSSPSSPLMTPRKSSGSGGADGSSSNALLRQSVHNSLFSQQHGGAGAARSSSGANGAQDKAGAGGAAPRLGRVQSWYSGYTPHESRAGSGATSRSPSPPPPPVAAEATSNGGSTPAVRVTGAESADPRDPQARQGDDKKGKTTGFVGILRVSHIRNVLLSYAFLALSAVAIDAVLVLYLYEPIGLGGLSFSSQQTGTLLFLSGAGSVFVQLLLFPYLQQRIGTLRLYRLSLLSFPLVALTLPLANLFAYAALAPEDRQGPAAGDEGKKFAELLPPETQALVWTIVVIAAAFRMMSSMSFSCNMLLVNQSARLLQGARLGTLNGLAQMSSSVMRAAGPYGASSLFAFSVSHRIMGGKLVWPIIASIGLVAVLTTTRIRDLEREEQKEQEQQEGQHHTP